MSDHTPGPWTWEYMTLVHHGANHAASDGTNAPCHYTKETGCTEILTIGEGYDGWFGGTDPEEADARLIAAAPDLLAALEWLLREPETLVQDDYCLEHQGSGGACRRIHFARRAIAKAKGLVPSRPDPGQHEWVPKAQTE